MIGISRFTNRKESFMPDDLLLKIARVIGLLGLALLIVSSVGGTLLVNSYCSPIPRKTASSSE